MVICILFSCASLNSHERPHFEISSHSIHDDDFSPLPSHTHNVFLFCTLLLKCEKKGDMKCVWKGDEKKLAAKGDIKSATIGDNRGDSSYKKSYNGLIYHMRNLLPQQQWMWGPSQCPGCQRSSRLLWSSTPLQRTWPWSKSRSYSRLLWSLGKLP